MEEATEGERCVRCGDVGEDRRTLRMSCFYAMDEMNVPFSEEKVVGKIHERIGTKEMWIGNEAEMRAQGFSPLRFPEYSEEPTGNITASSYTLRVCKDCRGSWMSAIEDWFNNVEPVRRIIGTGIFVRKNGATVEITQEEWDRRHAASNTGKGEV